MFILGYSMEGFDVVSFRKYSNFPVQSIGSGVLTAAYINSCGHIIAFQALGNLAHLYKLSCSYCCDLKGLFSDLFSWFPDQKTTIHRSTCIHLMITTKKVVKLSLVTWVPRFTIVMTYDRNSGFHYSCKSKTTYTALIFPNCLPIKC